MKSKGKFLLIAVVLLLVIPVTLSFAPASITGPDDQLIELAYPVKREVIDKSSGSEVVTGNEPNGQNRGYLWVPQEALGKSVPLIITLHGWRSFRDDVNIYVGPNSHKFFDKIARDLIDAGEIRPVVIAAPMHDRGPKANVFGRSYYDVNEHINLIRSGLDQLNVDVESVSITGHSNALCHVGVSNAVDSGQNFYSIGLFDGTCKSQNYAQKILGSGNADDSFVFHMYQPGGGTHPGHEEGGQFIQGSSPDDFQGEYSQYYVSAKKRSDREWYDLVFDGPRNIASLGFPGQTIGSADKTEFSSLHGAIPSVAFREMLVQFFRPEVMVASLGKGGSEVGGMVSITQGTRRVASRLPQSCESDRIIILGASHSSIKGWGGKFKGICGGLPTVNAKVGDPTSEMLAKMDQISGDYLIVTGGTNDITNEKSANYVKDNLAKIYAKAKKMKMKVIAGTILPYNTKGKEKENEIVKEVNQWIRQQQSSGLVYQVIDFYQLLVGTEPCMQEIYGPNCNNVHPNTQGYVAMAELVKREAFSGIAVASIPPVASTTFTGGVSSTTSHSRQEKQIDEVWRKISQFIRGNSQVWSSEENVWTGFSVLYPEERPTPTDVPLPIISGTGVKIGERTTYCVASAGSPEQRALLDMIAFAEGTGKSKDGGYQYMFGFRVQKDLQSHPVHTGEMPPQGFPVRDTTTTAAGRYQFLSRTYNSLYGQKVMTSFYPQEQEKGGLSLITKKRKVSQAMIEEAIRTGDLIPVLDKIALEWSSLPYSKPRSGCSKCGNGKSYYGGNPKSYEDLKTVFNACLKVHKGS